MYQRIRFDIFRPIAYGLRRQKGLIIAFVILLALSCYFVRPWLGKDAIIQWYGGWDVVISLSTLGIALLVWLAEMRQEWEYGLSKRLHAMFYFDKQLVMECRNAPLASEGDIRAWAQQLGAQMAGTKFLGLHPRFETSSRVLHDQAGSAQLYEIKMYLSELPADLKDRLDDARKQGIRNPLVRMDPLSGKLDAEVVAGALELDSRHSG